VSTGLDSRTGPAEGDGVPLLAPCARTLDARRVTHADGAATTVHVAIYPRSSLTTAIVRLPAPEPLESWCARTGVGDALVGGFFVTPAGPSLGELWIGGRRVETVPFDARFSAVRSCLHVNGDRIAIGPLADHPADPVGDLLQAGPALVADGRVVVTGDDPEGFAAGHAQFDSDITAGRHPRAAIGVDETRVVAVASEGRAADEAGLTLAELAALMAGLGARHAINLDGGGSTSLVVDGRLVNRPRTACGGDIPGGRALLTAIALVQRPQPAATAA
jgi:hypothetical protein